jgi:hypothetical protein
MVLTTVKTYTSTISNGDFPKRSDPEAINDATWLKTPAHEP